MGLDTIIMPPYAAAILDNAMGVVHFGQWREGVGGRQWAATERTSFFAVNYYYRLRGVRGREGLCCCCTLS